MMAGRGIVVSFVLESINGNPVRYRLREDTSFDTIFWSYTARSRDNSCLVCFCFMNSIVKLNSMPEDFGLASVNVAYASTIYVLWFGWLFLVTELEYCSNQWEEPC